MSQQNFSLEEFVGAYVSCAFEIFKPRYENVKEVLIPLECFERVIRERVSSEFGFGENKVIYLHHAFHWAFFCDKRKEFNLVQKFNPGKRSLYAELNDNTPGSLVEHIISKYGDYLSERVRKFSQAS